MPDDAEPVITHWLLCHHVVPTGECRAPIYDNSEIQAVDVVRRHVTLFPGHGPSLRIVPAQTVDDSHKTDTFFRVAEWTDLDLGTDPDAYIYEAQLKTRPYLAIDDPQVMEVAKQLFTKETI